MTFHCMAWTANNGNGTTVKHNYCFILCGDLFLLLLLVICILYNGYNRMTIFIMSTLCYFKWRQVTNINIRMFCALLAQQKSLINRLQLDSDASILFCAPQTTWCIVKLFVSLCRTLFCNWLQENLFRLSKDWLNEVSLYCENALLTSWNHFIVTRVCGKRDDNFWRKRAEVLTSC